MSKLTRFQFISGILTALVGCKRSTAVVVDDQAQWMEHASGPLDHVASDWMKARLAISHEMQQKFYGFGGCGRCGLPWVLVPSHDTTYQQDATSGKGFAPLCEDCWQDLGYAQFRMPYYEAAWKKSHDKWPQLTSRDELELIRIAVTNEKSPTPHSILLMPGGDR